MTAPVFLLLSLSLGLTSALIRIHCTDTSVTGANRSSLIVLPRSGGGQAFRFTSPDYEDEESYGAQVKCLWTIWPSSGYRLKFSCSSFSTVATSAPGDLCTGDFLRFYDEKPSNSAPDILGSSGVRYCGSEGPDFTIDGAVNVLFNTNNDGRVSGGFDCVAEVEALPTASTTTKTTTSTIASTAPPSTEPPPACTATSGPGVGKPCISFMYGQKRREYDGCINRRKPQRNLEEAEFHNILESVFYDESDYLEEDDSDNVEIDTINTRRGAASTPNKNRPRKSRAVFWCATETDSSGLVSQWGRCGGSCSTDPAGSLVPR